MCKKKPHYYCRNNFQLDEQDWSGMENKMNITAGN